jgi:hypothetical protein
MLRPAMALVQYEPLVPATQFEARFLILQAMTEALSAATFELLPLLLLCFQPTPGLTLDCMHINSSALFP